MAGLGRRTHYRKHLTDSVLLDLPEPNPPHSRVAKIVATRGSNQFDVKLANSNGQQELAILPTKFRKLVWLKRNDYVIVETADDESDSDQVTTQKNLGGIRCIISHILYQDQVRHLINKGLWPTDDPDFVVDDRKTNESTNNQPDASEDGIVYDETYLNDEDNSDPDDSANDPLLFVNTNRLARMTVQDSSSSEGDEGDDDED